MDSIISNLLRQSVAYNPIGSAALLLLALWSLLWKGLALWHAANARQKNWFVAILILNTAGILEIVYLFHFCTNKLNIRKVYNSLKSQGREKPH